MFGGALYGGGGAELTAHSQPVIDALNWQGQFHNQHGGEDLEEFISSFTPYLTSRHARYAGKRLDCQQCHRSSPIQNGKTPEAGFLQGRIAMMLGGQWMVGLNGLSGAESLVNHGLAPFPPPAAHPERASSSVVQGPVVIMPAGAMDKEEAAELLAWMMSPQILAEAAYGNAMLPIGRTAAQDPRFREMSGFQVFVDLMDDANAAHTVTTPISPELNEALGRVEAELLPQGGDPAPLLSEVQAQLAAKLKEALAYHGRR
jgi:ABC-type glycerol-3-phosphate transport system substrate-binding protein